MLLLLLEKVLFSHEHYPTPPPDLVTENSKLELESRAKKDSAVVPLIEEEVVVVEVKPKKAQKSRHGNPFAASCIHVCALFL